MFRFNFQRGCLLVMTLCALAAAARPLWVGIKLVRDPGKIGAFDITVPADDAPISADELNRAEELMYQIAAGDAPKEGFAKDKIESFARSGRKVLRAKAEIIRDRKEQELAYARSLVPRGRLLIGLGFALAVGWMLVVALIWRRIGPIPG